MGLKKYRGFFGQSQESVALAIGLGIIGELDACTLGEDFESAATKLLIVSFGSVLVAILAYLIISKMRSRGS